MRFSKFLDSICCNSVFNSDGAVWLVFVSGTIRASAGVKIGKLVDGTTGLLSRMNSWLATGSAAGAGSRTGGFETVKAIGLVSVGEADFTSRAGCVGSLPTMAMGMQPGNTARISQVSGLFSRATSRIKWRRQWPTDGLLQTVDLLAFTSCESRSIVAIKARVEAVRVMGRAVWHQRHGGFRLDGT